MIIGGKSGISKVLKEDAKIDFVSNDNAGDFKIIIWRNTDLVVLEKGSEKSENCSPKSSPKMGEGSEKTEINSEKKGNGSEKTEESAQKSTQKTENGSPKTGESSEKTDKSTQKTVGNEDVKLVENSKILVENRGNLVEKSKSW